MIASKATVDNPRASAQFTSEQKPHLNFYNGVLPLHYTWMMNQAEGFGPHYRL